MTRKELLCLIPCFIDHYFLVSDFRQLPWRNFLVFSIFYHCCLCIRNFHCLRHQIELVNKTVVVQRVHLFFIDMILVRFVNRNFKPWSCALIGISNTSYFCLAFPNIAVDFSTALYRILQGIAAGIGTSDFLRAALILSLNSSSFASMKYIPLNCLALSSFGR